MADELLPYYERELSFIRQLGGGVRRQVSEDRRAPAAREGQM